MLTIEAIQRSLQAQELVPYQPPAGQRWRRAAVLAPLAQIDGEWHLLFIRRTNSVAEHKGQVAFPGGAMDAEDASLEDTALREAHEEIGLAPEQAQILGRLPDFYTITGYLITPVVAVIPWPFPIHLSAEEVERVFLIPLAWLADTANRETRDFQRPGSPASETVIFFRLYDQELLWGATAHMTVIFLQVLGLA